MNTQKINLLVNKHYDKSQLTLLAHQILRAIIYEIRYFKQTSSKNDIIYKLS